MMVNLLLSVGIIVGLIGAVGPIAHARDESIRRIGSDKQLLLDDYIVASLERAARKLNQPTKFSGNPLIAMVPEGESSWDAGMIPSGFSSVIYDHQEKRFQLWYGSIEISPAGTTPEGNVFYQAVGDESVVLAYATSKDGLIWHRPALGIVNFKGTLENNVVLDFDMDGSGIFKDPHESDPAKKYKMLWVRSSRRSEIHASYSADGLHWTDYKNDMPVIFHPPGHDTQAAPYWDEQLGKYVAIIRDRTGRIKQVRSGLITDQGAGQTWRKHWSRGRNRLPENHSLRRVGQCESDDFVHWTPMRVIVGADDDDPLTQDQFYNMEVFVYEGLRIGLMTVMSRDPDYCRGEVQLVYSRDGLNWERGGNREIFLPTSTTPGDFDWGSIYPHQGPMRIGDEIWIYYTGIGADHSQILPPRVKTHRAGIGVARLRLDGFVSVDAGSQPGRLTTRPFQFAGSQLVINADAKDGQIVVEIQDLQGNPIRGFTARDCDPCKVDSVRHTVTWNGGSAVRPLQDMVVKIVFRIRNAKLYSFQFAD